MVKTIVGLLVVAFFVLVNAFFSGTEMAVISLNDTKMRKLAEDGDKNAKRMLVFLNNPGTFLATIQVGVTIADSCHPLLQRATSQTSSRSL